MPYLIDDEVKITDTYAIMIYLATSYAPELIGKTPEAQGMIDVLYSQLKDVKAAITGPCYQGTDRNKLSVTAKAKMAPLVKFLGNNDFIMGN